MSQNILVAIVVVIIVLLLLGFGRQMVDIAAGLVQLGLDIAKKAADTVAPKKAPESSANGAKNGGSEGYTSIDEYNKKKVNSKINNFLNSEYENFQCMPSSTCRPDQESPSIDSSSDGAYSEFLLKKAVPDDVKANNKKYVEDIQANGALSGGIYRRLNNMDSDFGSAGLNVPFVGMRYPTMVKVHNPDIQNDVDTSLYRQPGDGYLFKI